MAIDVDNPRRLSSWIDFARRMTRRRQCVAFVWRSRYGDISVMKDPPAAAEQEYWRVENGVAKFQRR